MNKKEVRRVFRTNCLQRDGYKCRICSRKGFCRQNGTPKNDKEEALDVHHITERNDNNYVIENGISVCSDCHLKCERFHITEGLEWEPGLHPNDLYKLINSSWRI